MNKLRANFFVIFQKLAIQASRTNDHLIDTTRLELGKRIFSRESKSKLWNLRGISILYYNLHFI